MTPLIYTLSKLAKGAEYGDFRLSCFSSLWVVDLGAQNHISAEIGVR